MERLSRDLRQLIESLNCHGVDYLVVGAYALAWYGLPRYTGDIDVLVRPIDGIAVRFIGKEAFLRNKRATGRLKDLADAEALEKA